MSGVPLILVSEPVARLSPPKGRQPSVAVVYAAGDGELHLIEDGKPMRWGEAFSSRFRTRYEIDLSDHVRQVVLQSSPPVALGGVYRFKASLSVGFRVFDPVTIVRRNIQDALPIVHTHLTHVCHDIAAQFPIEEARGVQEAINVRFRRGERLDEGIEIYLVRAVIGLDADATRYLQAMEEAQRSNLVKAEQHRVNLDDAARDNQVANVRQSGDLESRLRERMALAGRPLNAEELIRIHLERNPQDTDRAMQLLGQAHQDTLDRRDKRADSDREMVSFLVEKGLIRSSDVAGLRDRALSDLFSPPPIQVSPATVGGGWDDPLPTTAVSAGPAVPLPPRRDTGTVPGLIPVYIVIDESLTANITDLDSAIQALYQALIEQPEIASVIRLSVLGVADDTDIVRALETVDGHTRAPYLRAGGPARLSRAFERLLHCIPADAATLKAQHPTVRRPQVIVLTGSADIDGAAWLDTHRQLVDRDASHRSAPDVLALGVGAADPADVARIATRPDFAFVATTADVAQAIKQFSAFVRSYVLGCGHAVIDGDQPPYVSAPDGFHLANDRR
jgi:uncharacterized protein YegL